MTLFEEAPFLSNIETNRRHQGGESYEISNIKRKQCSPIMLNRPANENQSPSSRNEGTIRTGAQSIIKTAPLKSCSASLLTGYSYPVDLRTTFVLSDSEEESDFSSCPARCSKSRSNTKSIPVISISDDSEDDEGSASGVTDDDLEILESDTKVTKKADGDHERRSPSSVVVPSIPLTIRRAKPPRIVESDEEAEDDEPFEGVLIYEPTPRKPRKILLTSPKKKVAFPITRTPLKARVENEQEYSSMDGESPRKKLPSSNNKLFNHAEETSLSRSPEQIKPSRKATKSQSVSPPSNTKLTAKTREILPLQLIRELDRTVFRKKWMGLRRCSEDDVPNGSEMEPLLGLPQGIRIVWNNKLRNTAGRASWKVVKTKIGDDVETTHVTSIELATKVTDTEEKLRHTLSHELCHVAAWSLSSEMKPSHGPAFKLWAKRVMLVHPDISITTTHSYQISYKHQWRCTNKVCAKIFSRHSNSIDVESHGCPCGGRLVAINVKSGEIKVPKATPSKKSPWQEYLTANISKIRADHPGIKQSEIFKMVAERWKIEKQLLKAATTLTSSDETNASVNNELIDGMATLVV